MDDHKYIGTAHMPYGDIMFAGSIIECARWADSVIREEGCCEIEIREVKRKPEGAA